MSSTVKQAVVAAAIAIASTPAASQQPSLTPAQIARLDSTFAPYTGADVPGCTVGISRRDTIVLQRAWGSANLEHAVSNTAATVFEGGSISKQFTAAAVLRLAQQKKLSLDDDIRKYIPELPVYDAPITIRHLIHHTSGLRDWGTVMTIAGWPRGTKTYTQAHVLDIIARQRGLNYPVGTEYLYSNSNYNLLAMIAERVSGKSLAEFTRAELFEPLGMSRSGWRDDYTRIVPGRAQAYAGSDKQWRLQMPFENVYGNSSLLTTVDDLLKWVANLSHKRVGGDEFVSMQLTRGKLRNGRTLRYASGLTITDFRGEREIYHDGATAGYRTFLASYPDAGFAVALLCNAGNVDPVALGHQVASVVLPRRERPATPKRDTVGITVRADRLAPLTGFYRLERSDDPLNLIVENGRLRIADGPFLVAITDRHFTTPSGRTHFVFDDPSRPGTSRIKTWVDDSDTTQYIPVGAPPKPETFRDFAGNYESDEADAKVSVMIEKGTLMMFSRPATRIQMVPMYANSFEMGAGGPAVKFTRDKNGKIDGFLVTSGRARNVRFDRVISR